jgi:pilus assembly protein FimV
MVQSFDEVEDLTRFADESFDTDAVDLFEFTGDNDAPLTRLKSVILSLDWEISDEILDELIEEVATLRTMWEDDKVAQVYLQAMDKVGNYLRAEGVYAHHNAIKLLLTLFYNFEKIISSPDISGDTITSLLKADIRKFKVLQYQISMKKSAPVKVADRQDEPADEVESLPTENVLLNNLEATILGLDWEVTDNDLEKFNRQAAELHDHLSDNAHARILVQGLQAIGSYISEEKVNAHPDVFSLLHSFYDGLKALMSDTDLDNDQRQEIVIGQVSRLNSLKEIIAEGVTPEPAATSEDMVDHALGFENPDAEESEPDADFDFSELSSTDEPVESEDIPAASDEFDIGLTVDDATVDQPAGTLEPESEIDTVASLSGEEELEIQEPAENFSPAMETSEEQYPDEILDPDAIQPVSDSIADEFIEEELHISSKWQPDEEDSKEINLTLESDNEPLSGDDLEDELELLFSDDDITDNVTGSIDTADSSEFDELALEFEDEEAGEDKSESGEPTPVDSLLEPDTQDGDTLDFDQDLFLAEDETDRSTDDEELVTPALVDTDDETGFAEKHESTELGKEQAAELEDKLDSFFGISEDEETEPATVNDEKPPLPADELVTPALADTDEEGGFREDVEAAEIAEEPAAELEDKLDSFFDLSDQEPDIDLLPDTEDEETFDAVDDTVEAALSDADETLTGGFSEQETAAELSEDPTADIQDKLDSFFGGDEEPEAALQSEETEAPQEEPDSFFADETAPETAKDEVDATMPALADADEEIGFNEQEAVTALEGSALGEIDDKLNSFFDVEEEENDLEIPVQETTLSVLTAAAASLSSSPAAAELTKFANLVTAGKEEEQSTQQTVLLTLIESAVSLLAKNETAPGSVTIIQKLAAGLEEAENPAVLIESVSSYTSWQQDFFAALVNSQPTGNIADPPGNDEDVVHQVQSEFSQLRGTLMDEFDSIRKELKKK